MPNLSPRCLKSSASALLSSAPVAMPSACGQEQTTADTKQHCKNPNDRVTAGNPLGWPNLRQDDENSTTGNIIVPPTTHPVIFVDLSPHLFVGSASP